MNETTTTQLTPELKSYKEKTLNHLLASFSLLESKLETEQRLEVADDIRKQLEAIQDHVTLIQEELETDSLGEPVADRLYRRVATALTKERFYLANKLANKLETIEPFYPEIDRLRADIEAKRASRRIQSIANGGPLPEIMLAPEVAASPSMGEATMPSSAALPARAMVIDQAPPTLSWRERVGQLFQFHILVSCLVISLIACVMFGVGGMTVLQWLVEGG